MILRRIFFALAVLAGLCASQLPEFAQQYRQRLGGAIDELARIVADFDREAQGHGLTREAAIARLKTNADPLASGRGLAMAETTARMDRLSWQRDVMNRATPLRGLAVALTDLDPAVARGAMQDYEPALPLTTEGLLSALVGFLGFYAFGRFFTVLRDARRKKAASRRA